MKKRNIFKLLGIAAVIAIIGLSSVSCDLTCQHDGGTPRTMTVTGISSDYYGMTGMLAFGSEDGNTVYSYVYGNISSSGTLTGSTKCFDCDEPCGLNGRVIVVLMIANNSGSAVYSGGIMSVQTITGNRSFTWGQFEKVNSINMPANLLNLIK